jgi:hypothetical protein
MTAPTLLLPGQVAAPEGPCDMTGMYLMHHAFRRDLDRFVEAARYTPLGGVGTWRLLAARWDRFAHLLHEHHAKEDEAIWPLLLERADANGRAVLEAMEAEHDLIDPLLDATRAELAVLAAGRGSRDRLTALLVDAREVLGEHLAHEERDAIPLIQAHIDADGWAHLENTRLAEKPKKPGDLMFLLGWIADGLDDDVLAPFLTAAGPVVRLLLRLGQPRYRRTEARVFRHVPPLKEENR